ncbi:hypothetical protein AMAG_06179 [Allomyces macrogynus ATCC 38327]|uniref:Uncharacterized protein n=1 Tax=Allomyces macrogynus (strain ATCC 38327) TaxID=578462 RepID=A0A0L0SG36_ALLM3|nr:hypothetical protein AMAG_06179 [Allomyces macrogynus ATCC 38327]|eukprot:KNE61350.1 hypothetical protein AMAG_06179 [Allomyces macrogynus ATCC 38327]
MYEEQPLPAASGQAPRGSQPSDSTHNLIDVLRHQLDTATTGLVNHYSHKVDKLQDQLHRSESQLARAKGKAHARERQYARLCVTIRELKRVVRVLQDENRKLRGVQDANDDEEERRPITASKCVGEQESLMSLPQENLDEFATPPESPHLCARSTSTCDLSSLLDDSSTESSAKGTPRATVLTTGGFSPLPDELLLAYLAADSECPSPLFDTLLPPPALDNLEPSSSTAATPVGSPVHADPNPETLSSTVTTPLAPPALNPLCAMHPIDSAVATTEIEDKMPEDVGQNGIEDVDDALHGLLSVLDLRGAATPVSPLIKHEQVLRFPQIAADQVVLVDEAVHLWTPVPVRFSWWKTAVVPWTHPLLNDIATRVDQRRGELVADMARLTAAGGL